MTLAYIPRLVCLVLACFCLSYTVVSALVMIFTRRALSRAAHVPARSAARFLFILRSLPFAVAGVVAAGICLPSYLWYEPSRLDEYVSTACLTLALFGAIEVGIAAGGMSRASIASWRFLRDCRASGRSCDELLIIESSRPFLALAGIARPLVVMSQGIVDLLSAEELSVVLKHEEAHRASRDNLKRLCVALNPSFPALERAWARFAEYAADERAVAGDEHGALALASALVRVARFGQQPASPAAISFLGDVSDLPARVERLLAPRPAALGEQTPWRGVALALCLAALTLNAATLRLVQSALESLIR